MTEPDETDKQIEEKFIEFLGTKRAEELSLELRREKRELKKMNKLVDKLNEAIIARKKELQELDQKEHSGGTPENQ